MGTTVTGRRYFSDDDFEVGVTPSSLKRLGKAKQRAYILHWFGRNFEDPAQETPYHEGEYHYVWGGPTMLASSWAMNLAT
jgi:hypothetical protein